MDVGHSFLARAAPSAKSIWAKVRRPADVEEGSIEMHGKIRMQRVLKSYHTTELTIEYAAKASSDLSYISLKGNLLGVLTDSNEALGNNPEFELYLKLLESYAEFLAPLVRPEEAGVGSGPDEQIQPSHNFIDLLIKLATFLGTSHQPSLESVLECLASDSPFLQSAKNNNAANTILFSCIGWLSMVYQPSISTEDAAEPVLVLASTDFTGEVFRNSVYRQKRIDLREYGPISLRHMLVQCGDLVPRPCRHPPNGHPRGDVFQEQLVVSYLNFQALHSVAGIKVVLVDCISLHLDFDEKSRKLCLFRFPSFCKLMCRSSATRDLRTEQSLTACISRYSYGGALLCIACCPDWAN